MAPVAPNFNLSPSTVEVSGQVNLRVKQQMIQACLDKAVSLLNRKVYFLCFFKGFVLSEFNFKIKLFYK